MKGDEGAGVREALVDVALLYHGVYRRDETI